MGSGGMGHQWSELGASGQVQVRLTKVLAVRLRVRTGLGARLKVPLQPCAALHMLPTVSPPC